MRRSIPSTTRGILEIDWPLFGELCRALALKVAREYDPELILGIAKAGVIPGVVIAAILQRDFASMVVTRRAEDALPVLVAGPPPDVRHARVLVSAGPPPAPLQPLSPSPPHRSQRCRTCGGSHRRLLQD